MKDLIFQQKGITRRNFVKGTAAMAAAAWLPGFSSFPLTFQTTIEGVNLGVITYSFRSMPGSADDLLGYLSQLGLKSVELMGDPIEEFGGAPKAPKRNQPKAEKDKHRAEMRKWRLSVPMKRFKKLRKKYNAEGIDIEVVKFRLDRMSDEEKDVCFKIAETLGAKGITLERSDEVVKSLAPFADKHKKMIGYHNHARVDFNSWDKAVDYSPYNALNLDVGHYVAGTNSSPIPLIKKYHDRILSIHMKDRKFDEGPNMPWGQGDTPLKEVLQLIRKEKYSFMATIELEYPIPDGSDAVKEVGNCIEFCRNALG